MLIIKKLDYFGVIDEQKKYFIFLISFKSQITIKGQRFFFSSFFSSFTAGIHTRTQFKNRTHKKEEEETTLRRLYGVLYYIM